ncbi:Nudix (Nucleoside diphosphate linked moiety X)-type motif 1 [Coemansia sp. RSA 1085]|nr:Nudix (Nucleoside diphosphate linked moiety X)-type motif 1 [Coemansia sp. RSA 1085]
MTTPRLYTVIFPFERSSDGVGRVLLGLKKRGLGEGLWNGFGGKLETGETLYACAQRELEEECGLMAKRLDYVGVLFMKCSDELELTIFVYTAEDLVGDIVESDEMRPQWFHVNELPYTGAYEESRLWWPAMLDGARFTGHFTFNGDDLVEHCIEEVTQQRLQQLQCQILESYKLNAA